MTIYVTHDQVEAMTMGHRVVVLKDGYLQQVASPKILYDKPANVFVAAFIGSPSMNLFEAKLDNNKIVMGEYVLGLSEQLFTKRPHLKKHIRGKIIVGIRPEDFEDAALVPHANDDNTITTTALRVESLGSDIIVHFNVNAVGVDAGDPDAVREVAVESNKAIVVLALKA